MKFFIGPLTLRSLRVRAKGAESKVPEGLALPSARVLTLTHHMGEGRFNFEDPFLGTMLVITGSISERPTLS